MQFSRNVLHEHGMGGRDKVHLWPWGTNRILCSTFVLDTHYLTYRVYQDNDHVHVSFLYRCGKERKYVTTYSSLFGPPELELCIKDIKPALRHSKGRERGRGRTSQPVCIIRIRGKEQWGISRTGIDDRIHREKRKRKTENVGKIFNRRRKAREHMNR